MPRQGSSRAGADLRALGVKDGKVSSVANALVENQKYDLLGPNSNSAALAVANRAKGAEVDVPDRFDPATGSGKWQQQQFDEDQIRRDEEQGIHIEHVPAIPPPL